MQPSPVQKGYQDLHFLSNFRAPKSGPSLDTHIIVWFKAIQSRRRRSSSSKDYFFLVHNFVVGLIQKATTRPLLPVAPAVAAALLTPQKRPKERRRQNKKKKKSLSKQIIVDKWRSLWSKRDWERHWITQNEIDCFRGFPNSAEQTWLQYTQRPKSDKGSRRLQPLPRLRVVKIWQLLTIQFENCNL